MLEIFLITSILGFLYLLFFTVKKDSGFDLKEKGVYFQLNKKFIPYSKIISIERDMTNAYEAGTITYIAYIITFYSEQEAEDSFRFYHSNIDIVKWGNLKSRVIEENPYAKINESIL